MSFSSGEVAFHIMREIRTKRSMCYRPHRPHFELDGFWRPRSGDIAPVVVSMAGAIEAEVAGRRGGLAAASEVRGGQ